MEAPIQFILEIIIFRQMKTAVYYFVDNPFTRISVGLRIGLQRPCKPEWSLEAAKGSSRLRLTA